MSASSIFVSCMLILLIFNFFYCQIVPNAIFNITIGGIVGFIATILTVGALSGITVVGSGINTEAVKIMFGIGSILNILFQINIANFPVGFGLASNIISVFPSEQIFGIGFIIALVLGLVSLVSGLLVIVGGSSA